MVIQLSSFADVWFSHNAVLGPVLHKASAAAHPKLLSCFPDVEKASNPCGIYCKAGVAVEKRVKKLVDLKDELDFRIPTEQTKKNLT